MSPDDCPAHSPPDDADPGDADPGDAAPGDAAPGAGPLRVLGPSWSELPRLNACPAVLEALRAARSRKGDGARGALWIRGDEGSGRSVLLRAWIEERGKAAGGSPARLAARVACAPGMRFEEALFQIGDLLRQAGIPALGDVLEQRSSLAGKCRVLARILRDNDVLIALDDIDNLEGLRDGAPGAALEQLLGALRAAPGAAGELVLVSGSLDPPVRDVDELRADVVDLRGGEIVDGAALWAAWTAALAAAGGAVPPPRDSVHPELLRSPLALRLLFSRWRGLAGPAALADPAEVELRLCDGTTRLIGAVRARLSPVARRTLDVIALHGRPVSRGLLRALLAGDPTADGYKDDPSTNPASRHGLAELDAAGLLETDDGQRLDLHPEIGRAAARMARAEHPDAARAALRRMGTEHLQAALRARSLWGFHAAYRYLTRANAHLEAYEVQKVFAEEFLGAGFLDVARSVFEECRVHVGSPFREILTGNLAIVYKGEGRYDDAIRLYQETLAGFIERQDLPNIARVHHQIGNTLYLKGDTRRARECYLRCLDIAMDIEDPGVAFLGMVQLANLEFASGEHDSARGRYRQALEIAGAAGGEAMITALHLQLAQIAFEMKRRDEAEDELRKAEELARKREDRRAFLKLHELRGMIAHQTLDTAGAVDEFREAERHAVALGDPIEQVRCLIHISRTEEHRLRFADAAAALLDARDILAELSETPLDERALETLRRYVDAVESSLDDLGHKLGGEAFDRILEGLGRRGARR